MQAFIIGTRAVPQLVAVWANNPGHATYIVRKILKLVHHNASIFVRQLDGCPNRFAIDLLPCEACYGHEGQRTPAPVAASLPVLQGVQIKNGRIWIDGEETPFCFGQDGHGAAWLSEHYETPGYGLDWVHGPYVAIRQIGGSGMRNVYDLPRKYDLQQQPPRRGRHGVQEFETDVRTLVHSLLRME